MNLIIVSPHGRSGSLLMHSLFDQHPEVASLPTFFEYPEWEYHPSTRNCIKNFIYKYNSIFNLSNGYLGVIGMNTTSLFGKDGSENITVSKDLFLENLHSLLKISLDKGIKRNKFIEAIHLAYYQTLGFDIKKIKYILIHLHDYNNRSHYYALRDYKFLKYIAMIRDPREDWLSEQKVFELRHTILTNRSYVLRLYKYASYYRCLINSLNTFCKNLRNDQVQVVDLNKLHSLNKEGMKSITDWLEIEFINSLLISTFVGKIWHGNAANRKSITGFSYEKSLFKWPKILSSYEKNFISYMLREEINNLGYSNINLSKIEFDKIIEIPTILDILYFHIWFYIAKIINTLTAKKFHNKNVHDLPILFSKIIVFFIKVLEIYQIFTFAIKDIKQIKIKKFPLSNIKTKINALFL